MIFVLWAVDEVLGDVCVWCWLMVCCWFWRVVVWVGVGFGFCYLVGSGFSFCWGGLLPFYGGWSCGFGVCLFNSVVARHFLVCMIFACNLRRGFACSWLPFGFGVLGCLVAWVVLIWWLRFCLCLVFVVLRGWVCCFLVFGYSVLGGLARYRFLAPGFAWWALVF